MDDTFDLQRFVNAQDAGGTFERALAELREGRKKSHWMWFVFPQLAGLGESAMARAFAIGSLEEARAYLRHPVLGPRLLACVEVLAQEQEPDAERILGEVDALKLRSCLTLFARAEAEEAGFAHAIERYFAGVADTATDDLLGLGGRPVE